MSEFSVFIDESGLFVETSNNPADRLLAHSQKRKFASQLAGVIAPGTNWDEEEATRILKKCCKAAKVTYTPQFHANEVGPDNFSDLVVEAVKQINKYKLQPFRVVNEEAVSFGDRVSNYTNILAELLVRICHELSKLGYDSVELNVNAARVTLPDAESGELKFIESSDYLEKIEEYFSRAAIRKGYGNQTKNWKVKSFRLGSGKDDATLQVCDLISNASHDNFSKCSDLASSQLMSALGKFNFTLSSDTFYDEINEFVALNSMGLAFIALAQRAVDTDIQPEDELLTQKLNDVAKRFNALPASVKLPQLRILMSWLRQSIETRVDLTFSLSAAKWIQHQLVAAIRGNGNSDELLETWLQLSTTSLLITAQNHLGQTEQATKESQKLEELIPKLAGRWEYCSDIFESLIAKAVHQNDCFEHQAAKASMESVASFFANLTGFFAEAFPEKLFPPTMQSDLWAKALGTKVQSETFLLLQGKCPVEDARQTSDAAIEQFALADDKSRQYQFRSEIEAIAGNWNTARKFLAMSLGAADHTHEAIANRIAIMEVRMQGFPLLHWTRLGGMAAVEGDQSELSDFNSAFKASKLANNPWIIGTETDHYPVHGILRRMATVKAFNGDMPGAISSISRLRNIVSNSSSYNPIFEMILVASIVQVAAVTYKPGNRNLTELLNRKHPEKPGAIQLIEKLAKRVEQSHPGMFEFVQSWKPTIENVLNDKAGKNELALLGKCVGY